MRRFRDTITVFTDGLCEPKNPGGVATYGYVIYRNGLKIDEKAGAVGEGPSMSNNVAEYAALCEALKSLSAKELNSQEITVQSDSRLLVNQMNNSWKPRKGLYLHNCREATELKQDFTKLSFKWIPREENSEADRLSRRAFEEYSRSKKRPG